jgi:sulfotransferase family protein
MVVRGLMNISRNAVFGPVAIGGVGGSGTRLVAEIVKDLGFFMGDVLNPPCDNLFFTFLFKRPKWMQMFPQDSEILTAADIFQRAMTTGLGSRISQSERDYIQGIADELDASEVKTGADRTVMTKLLASQTPDLSRLAGWGWKEPNTHIFLPQLAMGIQGLKYIHVIRNGMDMSFSKNQQQARNWGRYICGNDFSLEQCMPSGSLDYWIAANRRAIEIGTDLLRENFLLVQYDWFCENPEKGIRKLVDFLGATPTKTQTDALKCKFAPVSIGRYRYADTSMFTQAQIDAVEELGFDIVNN